MNIHIEQLMSDSGVKFGTSGTRGLVKDMTDLLCFAYTSAFFQHLIHENQIQQGDQVGLGGRFSTTRPKIHTDFASAREHYVLRRRTITLI